MKRLLLPLLIILAAIAVAIYLVKTKPKAAPVAVEEKAWLVEVERVAKQTLSPTVSLYGRIESLWQSDLTAGVSADVMSVVVMDGSIVEKGASLLVLDDSDTRLLLAQRQAELAEIDAKIITEKARNTANAKTLPAERRLLNLTKNEVSRLTGLVKRKVSAQSALDTAKQSLERQTIALIARQQLVVEHKARLAELNANRTRAQALLEQAQIEQTRTLVVAPFNAVVTKVNVAPGKNVRLGQSLVQLYDRDAMVVRAQIPNRYLSMVRGALAKGQKLSLTGELDGMRLSAELLNLAGESGTGAGGVDGIFKLNTTNTPLQQGRFVHLELAMPSVEEIIAVPYQAIYGRDKVYVVNDENRMQARTMSRIGTMGAGDNRRVLIKADNIHSGERLVTTQLPNAMQGLLIRLSGD